MLAHVGPPINRFWKDALASTRWALGEPAPLKCMSYFPVVFKVSHVVELRGHLERRHRLGMEELAKRMDQMFEEKWCQFSLVCNYVWHFHRDEYEWSLQPMAPASPTLARLRPTRSSCARSSPPTAAQRPPSQQDISLAGATTPVARVAMHSGYSTGIGHDGIGKKGKRAQAIIRDILVEGYCRAMQVAHRTPRAGVCDACAPAEGSLHENLFRFETHYMEQTWLWDRPGCAAAQAQHYRAIADAGLPAFDDAAVEQLLAAAEPAGG